jgi:hypothetical protein
MDTLSAYVAGTRRVGGEKGINYRPNSKYENVRSICTREKNPSAKVSAGRALSFKELIGLVVQIYRSL